MNYILFDGSVRNQLLPFTFTRPVADIRFGILTMRERWEYILGNTTSTITEDYLSEKWPLVEFEENIMINAAYFPSSALIDQVMNLKKNEAIFDGEDIVAFYAEEDQEVDFEVFKQLEIAGEVLKLAHTWDIFSKNDFAINFDFKLITEDRESEPINSSNFVKNPENIFIEEGAVVENCSLNASTGPIYIGKDALVMEGCFFRGPIAIGEEAVVKMGAKIYGATTIGPGSRAGGEINNSVLFQNSNKGHEGYLGNSVLGEWCNLGADTNNSNLKNNYAEVRLWDYETEGFAKTGLQFCGLMMGDHSKCGINSMFNTGTVVGVSCNIFGTGYPRNFVPSFSWGGSSGMTTYQTKKVFEVARLVLERRKMEFTKEDEAILEHVFEETSKYRRY
ncbi:MAG: glucose-1-phosphate thymidylyltransferase [Zunongwangia sp.]|uniref:Glucose-1-phosphate thymidylyltransferase n=1 Tax=Zunongwangia profunda TaxID=398743 RepID=A0A3D5J2R4_9FLAO|nr:GlmU family protein [Zunongwangia profunda]MAC65279.1 glucose-1-phosphate thymidylyltransferase [Flavobacteriaceae bacterium]MAO35038.1 glucose-1-phosphate thymidylyltransferase [Zunongwangia sp.]HAJ82063.1 glucose-1-phosphate thymidylyltransferase [Zunongwangia profunda]HCV81968.1 glucose-1-phosphate thymidylyltransferase [Zunongwangia profunda]|tara:strand:- start:128 stop:1300 length:1173 start_codon:yes stop_codon:yes gene_type:complete